MTNILCGVDRKGHSGYGRCVFYAAGYSLGFCATNPLLISAVLHKTNVA